MSAGRLEVGAKPVGNTGELLVVDPALLVTQLQAKREPNPKLTERDIVLLGDERHATHEALASGGVAVEDAVLQVIDVAVELGDLLV